MDQVVHDQPGWFGKPCRRKALGAPGSRWGTREALCAILTFFIVAGSTSAQLLMSDNFDEVGNTNGAAPAGWTLSVPANTQAIVVNSSVTTPESAPYCVELTDNSSSSVPEIYQTFRSESNGIAIASFEVPSTGAAPAYLELKTSSGTFLSALVLDTNGVIGYQNVSSNTTVDTSIPWTPGAWQKLQIEWFADETFNAYIGGTQVVQRASFASAAVPSRISLLAGTSAGKGRTNFADDVQVVVADTLLSDDFDTNETVGSFPSGWVVTTPPGTSNLVVNSTVQTPLSPPNCVEFSDNGASSGPQMYTNFTGMADGRAFYSALIPSTNQAPFDMHLRDTNGNFLVAIRIGENGNMAYNDTPGGSGPFTATSIPWTSNVWQTIRIDWFSNYTFSAYLGSNQIVANAPFSTNTIPARVLFRLADSSSTSCLAYLDNVLIRHAAFPGPANHPNNATWLGYNYLGTQSYWSQTPQLAFQMKTNYRVPYWFINVGSLDTNGVLQGSVASVTNFLNTLKTWENQQGYQFKVLAWVNGDMPYSGGPTGGVDVNIASVASNIVMEAEKLVSTNVAGSYIAHATRAFDGVQLDLEPAGPNGSDTQFWNIVQIVVNIKSAFRSLGVGNKLTSFTSPSYTTSSPTNNTVWDWVPMYYYAMATNIDLLCAMTYDTGYTSGSQYQAWIQDQTTNILKMVSGRYWNNDAQHPAPTNDVQVMIGFPAFPNSGNHTNTAENISFAAPGVQAGLTNLQSRGDLSTNYFLGAAVYLQNDGTGGDGYASYDTDWWWFGQYWLNTWAALGAPADLLVNPASLNFGSVPISQTNSLPFSVINTGYQSLTGTATAAGPFAVTAGSPYNIGVGQTQAVTVSFTPLSTGAFTNTVVFTSNGGSSTNTVVGVGATPAQISVNPLSLDFGTVATGSSSQNAFLVTNVGGTAATNGTAAVTGGPFTVVSGNPFALAAGASTNVVVQFAPSAAGGFTNAVIVATANGGNSTNTVTGTGAVAPVASFTANPSNGVETLAVTFTDTSTGTAPLSLSWNLGDNTTTNTAGGAMFAHSYAAGTYTVTLTASNIVGSSMIVSNNLITVLSAFQAWQWQYFGCTNCSQAQADADPSGKGISNTNQFLLGLNPTNPASVFKILSVAPHGNDMQITWATAGGITNVVQATAGLADGSYSTNFVDVSPLIIIQGSGDTATNYLNPGAVTNFTTLYYRIRLQQ
jgi:PKD repeat protein